MGGVLVKYEGRGGLPPLAWNGGSGPGARRAKSYPGMLRRAPPGSDRRRPFQPIPIWLAAIRYTRSWSLEARNDERKSSML